MRDRGAAMGCVKASLPHAKTPALVLAPPRSDVAVEVASGKDAAYENFPVGSWLLPKATRSHVAVFYAFARAADDIADSATLSGDEKMRRLEGFEAVLLGQASHKSEPYPVAASMRASLGACGLSPRHCCDLLSAFRQDASKTRYRAWQDLVDYCQRSAAAVGRYLIDLHGGTPADYQHSDPLCIALQVLNHLQDCKDDFLTIDRVYLPLNWMDAERTSPQALDGECVSPAMRRVIDRALVEVDILLINAAALPRSLASWRLALESAVTLEVGLALCRKLRTHDPLADRVVLTKPEYAGSFMRGLAGEGWRFRRRQYGR